MKIISSRKTSSRGFTLIELLIVIAILGVLATLVIALINPVEALARTRDAGRKTITGQLGRAAQAYFTSQNATWPTANATWVTTLVNAGELKSIPTATTYSISGTLACTTNVQNTYCYYTNNTDAVVYSRLESSSEKAKCSSGVPYFIWSSADAQSGVVCLTAEPTATYSFSGQYK